MTEQRVVKGAKDLEVPQRPESPVVRIYLISFALCVLIKKKTSKHEIKIKNKMSSHSRDLTVLLC